MAFSSEATNLVEGDENGVQDVFVHGTAAGTTIRVSVDSSGAEANDRSSLPDIIEDEGRFVVAFESLASNLVAGDTNEMDDVFIHDQAFGVTWRASVAPDGSGGNWSSAHPALARDRSLVAFESAATNLLETDDVNDHRDVFVRDLFNDYTLLMSASEQGDQGNGWALRPDIARLGYYVAFASDADNLVPCDTNGTTDVFLREVDSDWILRVSQSSISQEGNGASDWPSVSSEGRFTAFASIATNLAPNDTNGVQDIFVHDRQYQWTSRVSVDSAGNQASGDSFMPSMSWDGRFVAFSSDASDLVEGDTNGVRDIFVHDRETGDTIRISVAADGSEANGDCDDPVISGDGDYVAFSSVASNLVPDDNNGRRDVFVWHREERTPLVIIPGLMGSRLFHDEDGEEVEVWANVDKIADLFHIEHPLMVAALADDGSSPAENDPEYTSVRTKPGWDGLLTRINGSAWGKSIDKDVYEGLVLHFLNEFGYTLEEDLRVFPYDWRKDLATAADDLDTLIHGILEETGASQVRIVAHSMGGLVTRHYLADESRAGLVERAVILGTPFLGTPKSFNALLNGECINSVSVGPFSFCLPDPGVIKALVTNFPGFYELMPTWEYFVVKGGGFYGVGENLDVVGPCPDCRLYPDTYYTAGNLPPGFNSGIHETAELFHSEIRDGLDDDWNGVPVSIVAGANHATIAGIREYDVWTLKCLQVPPICYPAKKTVRVPSYTTAGDGTVTRHSVSMANADTGYNLRGSSSYCAFDASHLGMVRDEDVLRYVDGELGLLSRQECAPLSIQAPAAVAARASSEDTAGAQIIARGAKAIHAYDAGGHFTGPDSETGFPSVAIPGSAYAAQDGLASVALRTGQPYTITVEPLGQVPLDVTLQRTLGNTTLTTTLYSGISATADSRVTLVGDPGAVNTWELDPDGEGTITWPISPTAEFGLDSELDVIAPDLTVSLTGTLTAGGWYSGPVTVTLSATDNPTGTGVARIEYATTLDSSVRVYSGPIVTSGDAVWLQAMAVDGALNITAKQVLLGPRVFLPLVLK